MASGDVLGRVELERAPGCVATVREHPRGGRAVHVQAGPVGLILDLDGAQAAELAWLLGPSGGSA